MSGSPGVAAVAPVLEVVDLNLDVQSDRGRLRLLEGISFQVGPGETVGIVGESGAGKTMLIRAIMGLLSPRSTQLDGRVILNGRDIGCLSRRQMRRLWGREIAMVFQDPTSALNPVRTVGAQLVETIRRHQDLSRRAARTVAVEMLESVQISSAGRRLGQYPHELSGGMRQRICIAIALAGRPSLLLADEPTTALDVTVQAEILELLANLQRERQMAMILVTHNLAVVATQADSIAVLYSGRIVEALPADRLVNGARMPYTRALLGSAPSLDSQSHWKLATISGQPPDFADPPFGCRFSPRCPRVQEDCLRSEPSLERAAHKGHLYRCWHPEDDHINPVSPRASSSTSSTEVNGDGGRIG